MAEVGLRVELIQAGKQRGCIKAAAEGVHTLIHDATQSDQTELGSWHMRTADEDGMSTLL